MKRYNRIFPILVLAGLFMCGCELDVTTVTIAPGQSKIVDVETHFYGAEELECSARLRSVDLDLMDVSVVSEGADGDDCFVQLKISVCEETALGTYAFEVEFSAHYKKDGEYESEKNSAIVKVKVQSRQTPGAEPQTLILNTTGMSLLIASTGQSRSGAWSPGLHRRAEWATLSTTR